MMMSGPDLVSMAEAIRGFRSFMLIRSTVTSTPAIFPNSAASRLNSTSEAGTKLTHSRMLSLVPFGKLGAFCAATMSGIPPTAAAPVAAPAALRNARRSSLVTPPGCLAMGHPRRYWDGLRPRPARRRPILAEWKRSEHRPPMVSRGGREPEIERRQTELGAAEHEGGSLEIVAGVRPDRVDIAPGPLNRIVQEDAATATGLEQAIDGANRPIRGLRGIPSVARPLGQRELRAVAGQPHSF